MFNFISSKDKQRSQFAEQTIELATDMLRDSAVINHLGKGFCNSTLELMPRLKLPNIRNGRVTLPKNNSSFGENDFALVPFFTEEAKLIKINSPEIAQFSSTQIDNIGTMLKKYIKDAAARKDFITCLRHLIGYAAMTHTWDLSDSKGGADSTAQTYYLPEPNDSLLCRATGRALVYLGVDTHLSSANHPRKATLTPADNAVTLIHELVHVTQKEDVPAFITNEKNIFKDLSVRHFRNELEAYHMENRIRRALYTQSADARFRDNKEVFHPGDASVKIDNARARINKSGDKYKFSQKLLEELEKEGYAHHVYQSPQEYRVNTDSL